MTEKQKKVSLTRIFIECQVRFGILTAVCGVSEFIVWSCGTLYCVMTRCHNSMQQTLSHETTMYSLVNIITAIATDLITPRHLVLTTTGTIPATSFICQSNVTFSFGSGFSNVTKRINPVITTQDSHVLGQHASYEVMCICKIMYLKSQKSLIYLYFFCVHLMQMVFCYNLTLMSMYSHVFVFCSYSSLNYQRLMEWRFPLGIKELDQSLMSEFQVDGSSNFHTRFVISYDLSLPSQQFFTILVVLYLSSSSLPSQQFFTILVVLYHPSSSLPSQQFSTILVVLYHPCSSLPSQQFLTILVVLYLPSSSLPSQQLFTILVVICSASTNSWQMLLLRVDRLHCSNHDPEVVVW